VHHYERLLCDADCALARYKLRHLERDYRQYWYDRRRGVPPMRLQQFVKLQRAYARKRPLWRVWDVA